MNIISPQKGSGQLKAYILCIFKGLDIIQVIADTNEEIDVFEKSYDLKAGILVNSENFDRLTVKEAMQAIIQLAEERNFGKKETQFKLRDAGYSRQRYWGEPFPIIYNNGIPTVDNNLPVKLPDVETYTPSGSGESPLANNSQWVNTPNGNRETDTMPGYAGRALVPLKAVSPKPVLHVAVRAKWFDSRAFSL